MPDPSSLRVLIIDDDPAIATLVRRILEAQGYRRITVVGTAADGLEAARDADLILLDQELPDGFGVDLVPRLVSRPDPPSVIMVTGAGNEDLVAGALRAGAEDYLAKNARLETLLPEIVERARRHRALARAQTAVEQDLIRAERLAAIGEMTVTLHHEINNPLMSASAEVELLLSQSARTEPDRESLQSIRTSLLRIREIIKRAGDLRQAETSDYLEGLRMISFAELPDADSVHRGRALQWIAHEDTGRVVALLLRHAGFTVERVDSARELSAATARIGASLVVLSVPGGHDAAAGLAGFIPNPNRSYAVVALVAGDPSGARAAGADRVIALPIDPATLANEVVETVDRRLA